MLGAPKPCRPKPPPRTFLWVFFFFFFFFFRRQSGHDAPIIRKSVSYAEAQVSDRLADWVDVNDKRRGIIAREYLPRTGDVVLAQEPESLSPTPCGNSRHKFQEPPSALWRRDPPQNPPRPPASARSCHPQSLCFSLTSPPACTVATCTSWCMAAYPLACEFVHQKWWDNEKIQ